MEKLDLVFGNNVSYWTKIIMYTFSYVTNLFLTFVSDITLRLKVYLLVFMTSLMDRADVVLQIFGVKLMKLTRERVLHSLTEEEKSELLCNDVKIPFEKYVQGLEKDDYLSLYRRIYMIQVIKHLLNVRVQTRKLLKVKPQILQISIRRPIFIVSLPRSGTTLLSRLLARDPALHAPVLRDMMHPYRLWDRRPDNSVYKQSQIAFEMDQYYRGEEYKKIHTIGLNEPEECLTLTMLSFWQHTDFVRLPYLSEYESWFYSAGSEYHKQMYETYKQQLQILTKGEDSRRLLLKCSIHQMSLESLLQVFPDACVVYTIRPVSQVVPSYCSNVQHLHNYCGPVDNKFGKRMLRLMSELSARSVRAFRKFDKLPDNQNPLYMCHYNDLVRDPIKTARKLYHKFGMELSTQTEENMLKYIKNNPQNKYGRHEYSLKQYGLKLEDVKRECSEYEEYMTSKGYNNVI